ncbi:MAG TPA: glycosyltransferase family 1 protein [Candidatus Nanoarchaeia archaeon]|nr:glycosyltransferase family 1 protein [Candidatus Nanoarchaeia archaeon]
MIRVLHVLGGLNRGGAETWLVQVMRSIDRSQYQFDFLVHSSEEGAYDNEVRELGGRIIPCLGYRNPMLYARNFLRVLRTHGPFDVVHSHVHHFSGLVMLLAKLGGVPCRIIHSHTAHVEPRASLARSMYLRLMKRMAWKFSTCGIAVSSKAAGSLLPPAWERDGKWTLLPIGIDLEPFSRPVDAESIRASLGIPSDAFVVGHVGRFVEAKNHRFLIRVAAELVAAEPKSVLLLVGDGPLRPEIEELVLKNGLTRHVVFTGNRADVPALMMGAMDVFVFPSVGEGFGLAPMEAQLSGLPVVLETSVPDEAVVNDSLVIRKSLTAPASAWAQALIECADRKNGPIAGTGASIQERVAPILRLYSESSSRC